jgi:hypothetical protein
MTFKQFKRTDIVGCSSTRGYTFFFEWWLCQDCSIFLFTVTSVACYCMSPFMLIWFCVFRASFSQYSSPLAVTTVNFDNVTVNDKGGWGNNPHEYSEFVGNFEKQNAIIWGSDDADSKSITNNNKKRPILPVVFIVSIHFIERKKNFYTCLLMVS